MKTFFIILLTFCSAITFGQEKITSDIINSNGDRVISISPKLLPYKGLKGPALWLGISTISNADTTLYSLNFFVRDNKISYSFPQNGVLLLKTNDGTVIKSYQILEESSTKDIIGQTSILSVSPSITTTVYNATPIYYLSKSDIEKIASDGISKIRMEASGYTIDKDLNGAKSKTFIENRFKAIEVALKENKSFEDNF